MNKTTNQSAQFPIPAGKLYFPYGSNLHDWRHDSRLAGLLKPVRRAVLPDHALGFNRYSSNREGGVLNIIPCLGLTVTGYLFEVQGKAGWDALRKKEGAKADGTGAYKEIEKVVLDDHGREITAITYEVTRRCFKDFVRHSEEYLKVVCAGFEAFELDPCGLERAAQDLAPVSDIDSIFVYGTLLRGECRHHIIQKYKPQCILLAEAPGSLLDLCAYPGMIPPLDSNSHVQGEFMRFNPEVMADLLKELDQIEGFRGFGQPGSLFKRGLTDVHVGDGRVRQAWVYRWADQPGDTPVIPAGGWREHQGKLSSFLEKLVQAHTGGNEQAAALMIASSAKWANTEEGIAEAVKQLLPLRLALEQGRLSERVLAKFSQNWATVPD